VTAPAFNVGAFVSGPTTSARGLGLHADLFDAYADLDIEDGREAYLSHFVFGPEMEEHYHRNKKSVAGYEGPCWCRWLILDIDRGELAEALADARKLVAELYQRYPETVGDVPIYFSGGKGFHVLVELAHNPPPAVGFHRVARTFAETLAERAGVRVDTGVYDINRLVRLPNTKHPRTGLFKRRVHSESLFVLSLEKILDVAKHPSGDGLPAARTTPKRLAEDWAAAEQETARRAEARDEARRDFEEVDMRAPRYFMDLLRFGVQQGERHATLFRCSAWLTEQGAPPSLCLALLTEAGRDVGLTPADVERQIKCGIEHALKQRSGQGEGGAA
jgi:hypothetical protein